MFYTRLPCPSWTDHSDDMLNRATRYFPLMGLIVAAISLGVYWAGTYLFSPAVSLLLSMIASVLTTGAFHEDGFADTCDGFGGGWTKGKILEIMKDSRVGTYGVVGLGLLLALKWAALLDIAGRGLLPLALALVSGHMVSRLGAVTVIVSLPYSRENEDSKAKPVAKGVGATEVGLAAAFTAVPLACWPPRTRPCCWPLLPGSRRHAVPAAVLPQVDRGLHGRLPGGGAAGQRGGVLPWVAWPYGTIPDPPHDPGWWTRASATGSRTCRWPEASRPNGKPCGRVAAGETCVYTSPLVAVPAAGRTDCGALRRAVARRRPAAGTGLRPWEMQPWDADPGAGTGGLDERLRARRLPGRRVVHAG
jgi:adenosylcobinamide-GDP ribazoletransferase